MCHLFRSARIVILVSVFLWLSGHGPLASAYGQSNSAELEALLMEMIDLAEEAREAARAGGEAESVEGVRASAERVFEAVWGIPTGLEAGRDYHAPDHHGWQERWQTTPARYDEAYEARLGSDPPTIEDPRELGIIGRGRYIREHFAVYSDGPTEPGFHYEAEEVVAPINNVIGWMRLGEGITKGEHQPRIDLTYVWDQPMEFWKSTASTGWVQEAFAQALNILRTDYQDDVGMARDHADGMAQLLDKVLEGEDVNGDGQVGPVPMEGGLYVALEALQSLE